MSTIVDISTRHQKHTMKRVSDEKDIVKHDYPDFTLLYRNLNELFFEKVISQIPVEIWTSILQYICKTDTNVKYNHKWVEWSFVSHKFRNAVYAMNDIFFNPIKQPEIPVLEKFHSLKILRITCNGHILTLPFLQHLEKIKIYVDFKNGKHTRLSKYHKTSFPDLNPELLPSLTSLSCSQSCVNSQLYMILGRLDTKITEKITKLRVTMPLQSDDMMTTLRHYHSLRILKIDKISLNNLRCSYNSLCPLLEEIHVITDNDIPMSYTGKARVYTMPRTLMENNRDAVFFSVGQVEKGKKIGEWKFYNLDKIFLYASDNSMVSRFNYTAFKSYMRPLKMVD